MTGRRGEAVDPNQIGAAHVAAVRQHGVASDEEEVGGDDEKS